VNLGQTGLRVSRVCLGMMSFGNDSERKWVLDEEHAEPIIRAAVEGGVTFFDTADTYSAGASEIATGRLLPKFLGRDEMVVAMHRAVLAGGPGPCDVGDGQRVVAMIAAAERAARERVWVAA